ncbi:phosphatidylserine decarboxylase [Paraneptunicella aestuarii]|uniref:archaetidylserine decarboxylase n=1 Tax=Paraneptunicella aestuarii TaxID=2831148 RepID=UPI001E3E47B2|nr:archaetidylserine decarboxylase [Paraneptunicella aestuarii]UAA38739.1 phosphatidylserine decarboxylase [Paraneptunicella aestuarii]
MLPDILKVKLQYVLPKHLLSRIVGKLAAAKAGWLTTKLIELFIKQYNVNMAEAEQENASDYATFNDFFTRPLKSGARPLCPDEDALLFPVDGAISQFGKIEQGQIFQAKGHSYSAETLLGGDKQLAEHFNDGQFMTIYLSPKDYHRIHMPVAGKLTDMVFVPGELFSVNPLTTANVPGLFARNERVVAIFDTEYGKMAMVLVGATIVASIETVWAGTIAPNVSNQVVHTRYTEKDGIELQKGDEMGRFKLGSTVVMLYQPDMIKFADVNPGDSTRMGERNGTLLSKSED